MPRDNTTLKENWNTQANKKKDVMCNVIHLVSTDIFTLHPSTKIYKRNNSSFTILFLYAICRMPYSIHDELSIAMYSRYIYFINSFEQIYLVPTVLLNFVPLYIYMLSLKNIKSFQLFHVALYCLHIKKIFGLPWNTL